MAFHCPWLCSGFNSALWLKLQEADIENFSFKEANENDFVTQW